MKFKNILKQIFVIIAFLFFTANLSFARTLAVQIKPKTSEKAIQKITTQPIIDNSVPEFQYIQPRPNQNIQNSAIIKGQAKNTEKIEFYIAKINAPDTLLYLGTAIPENKICEFEWDTMQTPNGQYFLTSKLFNNSQEFTGPKILIEISNLLQIEEKSKKTNEETAQKTEIIKKETQQNKEEIIQQKTEEINQETRIEPTVINNDIKKLDKKIEEISDQQILIQMMEKIEIPLPALTKSTEELEKLTQETKEIKQNVILNLSAKSETQKITEQKNATINGNEQNSPLPTISKEETKTLITQKIDSLEKSLQKEENQKQIKIKELSNIDSDKDGLPDMEEARLKTNPNNPDSDSDGYLDGDEVKNGYNPLKASAGNKNDKISYENPQETGDKKPEIYSTTKIEKVELENKETGIKFEGKALPSSFITLYIYSEKPIIVTVKTDDNGNWSYILDKTLEDGQHEIYVTVTDNLGKITAKSEPVPFAKTAQAITIIDKEKTSPTVQPIIEKTKRDYAIIGLSLILAAMLFAIIIVGFMASRKKDLPVN